MTMNMCVEEISLYRLKIRCSNSLTGGATWMAGMTIWRNSFDCMCVHVCRDIFMKMSYLYDFNWFRVRTSKYQPVLILHTKILHPEKYIMN